MLPDRPRLCERVLEFVERFRRGFPLKGASGERREGTSLPRGRKLDGVVAGIAGPDGARLVAVLLLQLLPVSQMPVGT